MYKDILVHIDASPRAAARAEIAATLAATHGAHLVGLHVGTFPIMPQFVEAQFGPEIHEVQRRYLKESAQAAEAIFTKSANAAGVSHEWRIADGDLAANVALHARYSDLVVIGQADPDTDDAADDTALANSLILDAGRPVLLVPYAGTFPVVGKKVLVAWNGSREATRAVNDALPLLVKASHVHVLAVNPTGGMAGHGDIPGADICLHLTRHGVNAVCEHLKAEDIDIGDMLLSRVSDDEIDLLVMGAYGRSRLREMVLGGATRHILRHMTVPVLMSH